MKRKLKKAGLILGCMLLCSGLIMPWRSVNRDRLFSEQGMILYAEETELTAGGSSGDDLLSSGENVRETESIPNDTDQSESETITGGKLPENDGEGSTEMEKTGEETENESGPETEEESRADSSGETGEESRTDSPGETESEQESGTETDQNLESESGQQIEEHWEDAIYRKTGGDPGSRASKVTIKRDDSLIFSYLEFPCYFKYAVNHGMDTDKTVAAYCLYNTLEAPENNQYHANEEGVFSKEVTYCLYNGCRYKGSRSYNGKYSTGNWKKDYYLTQVAVHIVNARQGRESSIEKMLKRSKNPELYDLAFQMAEDAFADSSVISPETNQSMEIGSSVAPAVQNQWVKQENGIRRTKENYVISSDHPERITECTFRTIGELPKGVTLTSEDPKNPLSPFWFTASEEAYRNLARTQTILEAEAELTGTEYGGCWYVPASSSVKRQYITFLSEEKTVLTGSEKRRVKASVPEQLFQITIQKKDKEEGRTLCGAVYGLYADSDCKVLISEFPETDKNGIAELKNLRNTQDIFYVKEIRAPYGYLRDTSVYPAETGKSNAIRIEMKDRRYEGSIKLRKTDRETGQKPQGDASLAGAVYGLFAREAVLRPGGSGEILFEKDEQAALLETDQNGEAKVSGLFPGKYYLKEQKAPQGYVLDEKEYDLEIRPEQQTANQNEIPVEMMIEEQVQKQAFRLMKYSKAEGWEEESLAGAGFSAWKISDLPDAEDGIFQMDGIEPVVIGENGERELFTDENGSLCSIPLPYGRYVVRETTVPEHHTAVSDFIVEINENRPDEPQPWIVLYDKLFSANVEIVKKDAKTGEVIRISGAEFQIWNETEKKFLEYAADGKVQKTFVTDENGTVRIPCTLKPGKYRLEEIKAPQGYLISDQKPVFEITEHTAFLQEEDTEIPLIRLELADEAIKGRIELIKTGACLQSFDGGFGYSDCPLEGIRFSVTAGDDIPFPDRRKDEAGKVQVCYRKGEKIEELITDHDGHAASELLPPGNYVIRELNVPEGYLAGEEERKVTLQPEEDGEKMVSEILLIENTRRKYRAEIRKTDAKTGKALEGAEFSLYAAEEIKAYDGSILIPEDGKVDSCITDDNGSGVFDQDLPLGSYYIKETKAPEGYRINEEKQEVNFRDKKSAETEGGTAVIRIQAENKKEETQESSAPQTGDVTPLAGLIALAMFSAGVLAVCVGRYLR